MRLIHGAVLGALLLSAPAMAFAGGGGLAGATGHPVTAAVAGSATNGDIAYAKAGNASTATDATYQSQSSNNAVPFTAATPLANQRGGGH